MALNILITMSLVLMGASALATESKKSCTTGLIRYFTKKEFTLPTDIITGNINHNKTMYIKKSAPGQIITLHLDSGKEESIPIPLMKNTGLATFSIDGRYFAHIEGTKIIRYDLTKRPLVPVTVGKLSSPPKEDDGRLNLSPQGDIFYTAYGDMKSKVLRFNKSTGTSTNITELVGNGNIDDWGRIRSESNAYTTTPQVSQFVFEYTINGKTYKIPAHFLPDNRETYFSVDETTDPDQVLILGRSGSDLVSVSLILNIKTGQFTPIELPESDGPMHTDILSGTYFYFAPPSNIKMYTPQEACPTTLEPEIAAGAPCNCDLNEKNKLIEEIRHLSSLAKCSSAFDPKLWSDSPPPVIGTTLNKTTAIQLLLKYQKPGSLSTPEDVSAALAILESNLIESHPDLANGLFETLASEHPQLFESTVKRNSKMLPAQSTQANLCRTKDEAAYVQNSIRQNMLEKVKRLEDGSSLNDWAELRLLSPLLKSLPEPQKEELYKATYNSLATGALKDPQFSDVFYSKLVKFTKQSIAPFFGFKKSTFTDTSVGKIDPSRIQTIILGTEPIADDYSQYSKYGFFHTKGPEISESITSKSGATDISINTFSWVHNKQTYTARFATKWIEASAVIPKDPGPSYDQLWADKKLSGTVVIGSNFYGDGAEKVKHHYINYYQNNGFVFKKPEAINNTQDFIRNEIASGNLDYLVKDAHSSGDEKTSMPVSDKSTLFHGERKVADNKWESIYIVVPSDKPYDASWSIKPSDLQEAMAIRTKAGKGQLIYLNSSCSSYSLAKNEMATIQSPDFINIAANSTTTSFSSRESHPKKSIIDGIRNGASWSSINEQIKGTPDYSRQRNVFLLPSTEEFQSAYGQDKIPSIQIDIKGPDGSPYNMAEHAH